MPLSRLSLRSFLHSARTALNDVAQQSPPVTLVIGNESADLDSICSAVVLAYLRTYASASKSNALYIPVSNIPRADLSLRPELIPVLSHANLKPSDLITLSDLPSTPQGRIALSPEQTKLILVDHNALQGDLGQLYGPRIAGCIDHHDEEGKVPQDCGEEPRIVRKCGSCSSLIVEYCRVAWDSLAAKSTDEEPNTWYADLARLALGPILVDTTNLTSKTKVTQTDIEAVAYLESWITKDAGEFNTKEYFKTISAAKLDIGMLDLSGILRKDYKQWTEKNDMNLGISSVVKSISFLVDKAGDRDTFFKILTEFAKERNLSVCSIMTTAHANGIFRRELFVWGLNIEGAKSAKNFEAQSGQQLGLNAWENGLLDLDTDGQWRRCWWQEKTEHSRKQVAPLLRNSMDRAP